MHAMTLERPEELTNRRPTTVAVHLIGDIDERSSDAVCARLGNIAEQGATTVIVHTEQLRLHTFAGFRNVGRYIQDLLCLGRDVRISASSPQLRAVLHDMDLAGVLVKPASCPDGHVVIADPGRSFMRAS